MLLLLNGKRPDRDLNSGHRLSPRSGCIEMQDCILSSRFNHLSFSSKIFLNHEL